MSAPVTLPYDYARCLGGKQPACDNCRRRTDPGREVWQTYLATPPVDILTGRCEYQIPTTAFTHQTG